MNKLALMLISIALCLACLSSSSQAYTIDSFPWQSDFSNMDWESQYKWTSQNAYATTHTSGGWNNNPYAEFVIGNTDGTYSAVGNFDFPGTASRINVRYLLWVSSDLILVHPDPSFQPKVLDWRASGSRIYLSRWYARLCGWSFDCYHIDGTSRFSCESLPSESHCNCPPCTFKLEDWLDQWISVEHEYDTATQTYRIYVTTQDGTYNEDCVVSHNTPASAIGDIQYLGYYGYNPDRTSSSFFRLSELVIDNSYIGPPQGFYQEPMGCDSYPDAIVCEDFNQEGYPIWTSAGATHNWMQGGGWNGSSDDGSARFTLPYQYDGYAGIGSYSFGNTPILHVGYLTRIGPEYINTYGGGSKNVIFNRDVPEGYDGDLARVVGGHHSSLASQNDIYQCANIGPCEYTRPPFRLFRLEDYVGEWVYYEFMADIATGEMKLWITTRDGTYNEQEYSGGTWPSLHYPGIGNWGMVQFIGFYGNALGQSSDAWFELDNVVIDDEYIGPPSGFITGGQIYECSDGIDNDGDTLIDFPDDLGCSSLTDNDETNCGDGPCEGGETCQSCADDCGQCCGNGNCESQYGEDCLNCPQDCTFNPSIEVCCSGAVYTGNCCEDANCTSPETCINRQCQASASVCPDGTCNGTETCLNCPQDCGSCGNYLFYDDFSTNTTGEYAWTHYWTEGGLGSHSWDQANERLEVLTENDVGEMFSHSLPERESGLFSLLLSPTTYYPGQGTIAIRLMQDSQNYYEFLGSTTPSRVAPYLKKVVNGVDVDYLEGTGQYSQGNDYQISFSFSPESAGVNAFGEDLTISSDQTSLQVGYLEVEVGQQDAFFDDILLMAAYHRADTNQDGCINLDELLAFIDRWKVSSRDVPMPEVMEAIGLWKQGTGC